MLNVMGKGGGGYLKISNNKKVKSHISKNKKWPISNLKDTPFPPTSEMATFTIHYLIGYGLNLIIIIISPHKIIHISQLCHDMV